jgi:hypothetical protein
LSAASVLARLGVTVDGARGNLVRDRPGALVIGRIAVSSKENVMDEPKEEDEKKTAEVCMAEMWRIVCLCNRQRSPTVHPAVQATPNNGT